MIFLPFFIFSKIYKGPLGCFLILIKKLKYVIFNIFGKYVRVINGEATDPPSIFSTDFGQALMIFCHFLNFGEIYTGPLGYFLTLIKFSENMKGSETVKK